MDKISRDILLGSILGDGHVDKPTRNGSRWIVKYDDKALDYLEWLHTHVAYLFPSEIKAKKNYHQHYFSTRPSKEMAKFRKIFYPYGKKIIPKLIKTLLTNPLSLAVWYMDDGTLDNRNRYHFNASFATYCFSYKECGLLANVLKGNFGIEARVHRSTMRGKRRYKLYIVSQSMAKFIDTVRPYIQPCFAYKIAL